MIAATVLNDPYYASLVAAHWHEYGTSTSEYTYTFVDGSKAVEGYVDRPGLRTGPYAHSGTEGDGPAPAGSIADLWYRGERPTAEVAVCWERMRLQSQQSEHDKKRSEQLTQEMIALADRLSELQCRGDSSGAFMWLVEQQVVSIDGEGVNSLPADYEVWDGGNANGETMAARYRRSPEQPFPWHTWARLLLKVEREHYPWALPVL